MENNKTELVFILDRSGSMRGLEDDTIGGFNGMLAKQKAENEDVNVTTENDSKGVALNYEVVGSAVRRAVACEDKSMELFDDDWAEEIEEYHESKNKK